MVAVELSAVGADVERIVFVVSIDQADARRQNFGQVRAAYCRVVNQESDAEMVRFDLSEDAAPETCMIFSEIYRHNGGVEVQGRRPGLRDGPRRHRRGLRRPARLRPRRPTERETQLMSMQLTPPETSTIDTPSS